MSASRLHALIPSHSPAAVVDPGELPLCVQGSAVPRLYLLGAQKCGTGSFARLLFGAGIISAGGIKRETRAIKELHALDSLCGCLSMAANYTEWDSPCAGCRAAATPTARRLWVAAFARIRCGQRGGTLSDMTPSYMRLPRAAAFLRSLYDAPPHLHLSEQLRFIVMLRDPLLRMQSAFHMIAYRARRRHEGSAPFALAAPVLASFAGYVRMLKEWLPANLSLLLLQREAIARNRSFDFLYRSLYSLALEQWLQEFRPRQFVVVPMSWAMTHAEQTVRQVGEALSVTVDHRQVPSLRCSFAALNHRTWPE